MRKIIISLLILLFPAVVYGQTGRHVSLGAKVGPQDYMDHHFRDKEFRTSPHTRLRWSSDAKLGWNWEPEVSVNWSEADFDTDVGGFDTRIGSLRTVPVLAGIGLSYRFGRVKVGLSAQAGPSINDFTLNDGARVAYQDRLGRSLDNVVVENSLAVRPSVSVWYDLGSRIGLYGAVSYFYNRPSAITTVDGVMTTETWKNDHLDPAVGMVFGIF